MDSLTLEQACAVATAHLRSRFCTCVSGAPPTGVGLYIVSCGRCGGWKYLTPVPATA